MGTGIIVKNGDSTTNVITAGFLVDRIKWLFIKGNLIKYTLCAASKLFYLMVSTGGIILFGLYEWGSTVTKRIRNGIKEITDGEIALLFMGGSSCIMFILSCINGTGGTYQYFIYGRYYEYTISFLLLLGALGMVEKGYGYKYIFIAMIITIITGMMAIKLDKYDTTESMIVDTNRYAGLSYAISQNDNFKNVFLFSILVVGVCLTVYIAIRKFKAKKLVIPLVVFLLFMLSNNICIEKINEVNLKNKSDMEMAEYIMQYEEDLPVYFVYEPYRYEPFFKRMQVFIKNRSMHMILPEEMECIEENAFIVTYLDSEKAKELKSSNRSDYIMKSTHYEVFRR